MSNWQKGITVDVHPSLKIGKNSFVWSFTVILEDVTIGDNCLIGSNCHIGRRCRIGNNVRIQDKVHLTDDVIVEDNVFISPMVITTNDRYPKCGGSHGTEPPYFEKNCSVGAGAVILPGVRIGENSMIGAGAVVTKNVKPGSTVVGVPAYALDI